MVSEGQIYMFGNNCSFYTYSLLLFFLPFLLPSPFSLFNSLLSLSLLLFLPASLFHLVFSSFACSFLPPFQNPFLNLDKVN